MKKLSILLSALLLQGVVHANDYDYELSGLLGANFSEPSFSIENQLLLGAEMQFNNLSFAGIAPELSLLYSFPSDYRRVAGEDTSLMRLGVNGVYDFEKMNSAIPFLKAGLGYQFVDNEQDGNTDGVFLDLGVGAKIDIMENLAFKLEGLYLVKYRNEQHYESKADNNFLAMAGLTYRFGYNAPAKIVEEEKSVIPAATMAAPVAVAAVAAPKDSDNDGVIDANDKCANTPAGLSVNSDGCMLDNDNDGVANSKDECPNTHSWATVNSAGCAVKMSVNILYPFDSDSISDAQRPKVTEFATFLKKEPYNVEIIGHADSSGPAAYNKKLSLKRAESLSQALISDGIEADRLSTIGKGEEEPIATNETEEGRSENRRIEIMLIDPK